MGDGRSKKKKKKEKSFAESETTAASPPLLFLCPAEQSQWRLSLHQRAQLAVQPPALCQGRSGKRVEVVGIFSSVSVAQGILWVMLEDKFLSLLEPWDYPLQSLTQEPHHGPRALS